MYIEYWYLKHQTIFMLILFIFNPFQVKWWKSLSHINLLLYANSNYTYKMNTIDQILFRLIWMFPSISYSYNKACVFLLIVQTTLTNLMRSNLKSSDSFYINNQISGALRLSYSFIYMKLGKIPLFDNDIVISNYNLKSICSL